MLYCYVVPNLPRTDNDLEHLFGSHRHHERRATGRKVASPSLVLRGSVRIAATTAARLAPAGFPWAPPHDPGASSHRAVSWLRGLERPPGRTVGPHGASTARHRLSADSPNQGGWAADRAPDIVGRQ